MVDNIRPQYLKGGQGCIKGFRSDKDWRLKKLTKVYSRSLIEKKSEFYVERRMNSSIKSFIAGKGIDDIL